MAKLKLIQYDKTNSPQRGVGRSNAPILTIYQGGKVNVGIILAQDMKLSIASKVVLLQEEDESTNWYISHGGENAFNITANGKGYKFIAGATAKLMLDSVGFTEKHATVRVANAITVDGRRLWPILMSSAEQRTYTRRK